MDLKKVIKSVVENAGGKENISSITHCATRLRIELQDETKYDRSKLEDIEGVKGVFFTNGQLQIIFGSGLVQQVFRSYNEVFGDNVSKVEKENVNRAKPKGNIAQRFVKMLSDIFVPIIPAIVAGGLLMGINNILTAKDIFFAGKTLIEAYPKFADLAGMLNLAFKENENYENLIFHSDQGWQYQHYSYQEKLKEKKITQSMSRKGNSLDNGLMECFFGLLKLEMFYEQEEKYKTLEELKEAIEDYIYYYNNKRIKEKLKGLTPASYRSQSLLVS